MMRGRQDQSSGGSEGAWVAAVLLAVVALWLLWAFARSPIVMASFALDWVQLKLIEMTRGLGPYGTELRDYMEAILTGQGDAERVTFSQMVGYSTRIGEQIRLWIAGLIAAMAVVAAFRMKGDGFRRTFSLTGRKKKGISFADYQALHWRVSLPGARFDPEADDDRQAPARTPMEWMCDNGVRMTTEDGLDEEAAERAFERQLGERWNGVERAPVHVQALCVMFGLSGRGSKVVQQFKEEISSIWALESRAAAEKKTAALIAPYLKDAKLVRAINRAAGRHAFVATAMFSLLDWARQKGGVLASAEFRWLKPVDRDLWYALNNCGRRAFHIEGAGAVAHFFSERVAGTPLTEPHVDEAVRGLLDYLQHQDFIDQQGNVHLSLEEFFRVEED